MNAQIPYLAGLAQQAAGPATLRPARRLFADDAYTPSQPPGRGGPGSYRQHIDDQAQLGTPGAAAALDPGDEPASPDGRSGTDRPSAAALATAPTGGSQPPHPGPLPPPSDSRPLGETTWGRSPTSWADPLWHAPVELPPTIDAGPATSGTPSQVGPAALRDLAPPSAPVPGPTGLPGQDPGGSGQQPGGANRARVSIGTIEVTVVPPSSPAAAHEAGAAAQAARGRTRPPSLLTAGSGAARLRDGLRRWYGTAQV
jgi:hypothetical protein